MFPSHRNFFQTFQHTWPEGQVCWKDIDREVGMAYKPEVKKPD
jgi:hypothetical protein